MEKDEPIRYLWVPFSWLENGDLFEPIDVLYGYCPIFTKDNRTHGIARSHRGEEHAIVPSEEHVRICLAHYTDRGKR